MKFILIAVASAIRLTDSLPPCNGTNGVPGVDCELASQNKVFRFFYDDALMTFSFEYMSTNPEYHTYIDNKLWFKRYIVNSTGDEYYLNKQKIFSQRMSLRHVFKTQIYYENDMIKCSKRREVINGTKQS